MAQPNRQPRDELTLEQVTDLFKETLTEPPHMRDAYWRSLQAIEAAKDEYIQRFGTRVLAAFDGKIVHHGDDFWAVLDWVESSPYSPGRTAIKRVGATP